MPPSRSASLQELPKVFGAAQHSASSHRRGVQTIHKVFAAHAAKVTTLDNGAIKLTGEKEFMLAFKACVDHLLDVKKGTVQADRVVKFVADFLAFALEHDAKKGTANSDTSDEESEDTPATRLASTLLKHFLKGFPSANKNVRFRCTQLVAHMMSAIPELDEDLFALLQASLLERVRDREPYVRVQAIIGLAKLQNAIGPAEDQDDDGATRALLDAMAHDSSAQARRAALFQLDLQPSLLQPVIKRTRDVDINNRRYVYQGKLSEVPMDALSLRQRAHIIKSGLKDREPAVQRSAGRMVTKWAGEDLVAFVTSFDLANHLDDVGTVEEALKAVFENRPDLAAAMQFDEAYWANVTPDKAFLAKVLVNYFKAADAEERLDDLLPTATSLASFVEAAWLALKASLASKDPTEIQEREFVLRQLLELCLVLDFADEMGRRRMMDGLNDTDETYAGGIRGMVSDDRLPLDLLPVCFDLLKKLISQDSALIHVAVEIVQTLREEAGVVVEPVVEQPDDDSDDEADEIEEALKTPSRKPMVAEPPVLDLEKKDVHIRCLSILRVLLERVVASIKENPILRGVVHEVIVPSVRAKDAEIRELGIVNLGLCSMLDKDMAIESFGLFVNQALTTDGALQEAVYKIIFDLLLLYGIDFLAEKGHGPERLIEFVEHALEQDAEVQMIATVGLAKLLLSGVINDASVLSKLVIVYFAPETADNQELRQCLTYFFPVYCYSSPVNQRRMQSIALPALQILVDTYEDADNNDEMVSPTQVAAQLIDWTDPTRVVATEGVQPDLDIHADLATDILKEIYVKTQKDERKRLTQYLGKLHLPEDLDDWKVRSLVYLATSIQEDRPLVDATSRNALLKFEANVRKTYGDRAEALNDEEHADVAEFAAMVRWMEDIKGELDEVELSTKRKSSTASKRKTASSVRGRGKRSTSRAASEDSAIDDDDQPPLPTDTAPRRSTRSRAPAKQINEAEVDEYLKQQGAESEVDAESGDLSEVAEEESDFDI